MTEDISMNPNELVRHLGKMPAEFTKADIIKFLEENQFRAINFRYVTGTGKLKTLNFVITGKADLDRLLSTGERVDGSSLFSYIDPGSSDLYVVPRFRSAYVNPFAPIPTLDLLCDYYTAAGDPLDSAGGRVLAGAQEALKRATGFSLEAMGELEYYVIYEPSALYPEEPQKGYHNSTPFSKWEALRVEAMEAIARAGGRVKYGHSEVGHAYEAGLAMEQAEIEFMPVPAEQAADQLVIAKWMLRMVAYRYGVTITFAPKIIVGHAGNGLHIHTRLVRDGRGAMVNGSELSDAAKKTIAGFLTLAPALTAFGNTVPTSYLRLVPHQEAPTNVCWGERNRSALVRVPLGWAGLGNLADAANAPDASASGSADSRQTVEVRSPDGSAYIHFLLAGLAVAARHGLEMDNALQTAERLYVGVNIFRDEHQHVQRKLPCLPTSCAESATALVRDRAVFERDGVFPPAVIDGIAETLRQYKDQNLRERLEGDIEATRKLVQKYLHC